MQASSPAVGPPEPLRRQRVSAEKIAGMRQMLAERCNFDFANGSRVTQRRIGDRSALATFKVIRYDGEEATFSHGLLGIERGYLFAMGEIDVKQSRRGRRRAEPRRAF